MNVAVTVTGHKINARMRYCQVIMAAGVVRGCMEEVESVYTAVCVLSLLLTM